MFEIEIKAHVRNRAEVIEKLNSFAQYQYSSDKMDYYCKVPLSRNPEEHKSARFRHEKIMIAGDVKKDEFIFTYKREKKHSASGEQSATEVNTELECTISDPEPIKQFLYDLGGQDGIVKHKIVECYHFETECGTANIELCNVPPLGDFLEIEIVSENSSEDFIQKCRKVEEEILLRCNINLCDLEEKYYSDMLLQI